MLYKFITILKTPKFEKHQIGTLIPLPERVPTDGSPSSLACSHFPSGLDEASPLTVQKRVWWGRKEKKGEKHMHAKILKN